MSNFLGVVIALCVIVTQVGHMVRFAYGVIHLFV